MDSTILHIDHQISLVAGSWIKDNLGILFQLNQIRKPKPHSSLAEQWWNEIDGTRKGKARSTFVIEKSLENSFLMTNF